MKICLAGTGLLKDHPEVLVKSKYLLESFYSVQEWQLPFLMGCEMFLLDSGAFTFMNSKKGGTDFDEYLKRYAAFIKQYNIKNFFELDVDSIVGYEKVKEMRRRLENETGRQCIPVWHKSRGIDDFIKTSEDYDYMAIGGIVTKEIPRTQWGYFRTLIDIAHRNDCKIHGLGFTDTTQLHKYKFDSVDSTTWNVGNRFGNVCTRRGDAIIQVHHAGKRVADRAGLMLYNFGVWCDYQRFADIKL